MDGTILSVGNFTQPATAVAQTIVIPSNADFLTVTNYTQMAAGTSANYGNGYWQRGMGTTGVYRTCAGVAAAFAAGSFVLYDPSNTTPGAAVAITNIDAATGIVLTGNTAGVSVGSIVRLSNLSVAAAAELQGLNFTVTAVTANTSLTLAPYQGTTIPLNATAAIGACTGYYRLINPGLFYPRTRVISNIAIINGQSVVSTTVNHGYSAGQEVRFVIPTVTPTTYGMSALDGLTATVVPANAANAPLAANAFAIDLDVTGLGTFLWPIAASVPFTFAQVVPFGDNTATALAQVPPLSSLEDAVFNTGYLGLTLAAGATSPAGAAADVIYWQAGKASLGGL